MPSNNKIVLLVRISLGDSHLRRTGLLAIPFSPRVKKAVTVMFWFLVSLWVFIVKMLTVGAFPGPLQFRTMGQKTHDRSWCVVSTEFVLLRGETVESILTKQALGISSLGASFQHFWWASMSFFAFMRVPPSQAGKNAGEKIIEDLTCFWCNFYTILCVHCDWP